MKIKTQTANRRPVSGLCSGRLLLRMALRSPEQVFDPGGMLKPGDHYTRPDGTVVLVQPSYCPNGHRGPRIFRQLCARGGHHGWRCETCTAEIHAECACQSLPGSS